MNLSRICVRSRLKTLVLHQGIRERSTACPSYSSSGDLSRAVTKLGLPRISTMIMAGKPNRPFPEELGVEVESMSEGGKQAAEVVTGFLTEGDYGGLEGLLSSECIDGLVSNLQGFSAEEKKYLLVRADDVFFSFIPELKTDSDGGGQSLTLVLFSFPGLGEMKEIISSNRQQMDDKMSKIFSEAKDNKVDGGAIKESINQTLQDAKERIETNDPHLNFRENEILISNLVFHRSNLNSDWTIHEVTQVNSEDAWPWIFRKRWKGRLGISMRGTDFNKVLRVDYITDWIAYLLIFNVVTGSLMSGAMMGGGAGSV